MPFCFLAFEIFAVMPPPTPFPAFEISAVLLDSPMVLSGHIPPPNHGCILQI